MLKFFKKSSAKKESLMANEKHTGRAHFHSLRVQDITIETPDCVSVAFEVPENLQEEYKFIPGQYLTLETEIDGEKVRRSYSLCSSPLDGELRVAIKKVELGKFSTWANESLKVGSTINVMTPEGNFFTPIKEGQKKNYVAFAAGSGITPIYSIIKAVLEVEVESTFTLFYGNQTSNTVIFKDKIDGLKNTYMDRLEIHHVLSREDQGSDLLKGRIDDIKCESFATQFFEVKNVHEYFLCGPEGMINGVSTKLKDLGANSKNVHFELFTSPVKNAAQKTAPSKEKGAKKVMSKVSVILDGEETHFDLSKDGFSVLDAALDAGADVPYACKGAVCCTCRAKVVEGSAEMDMNYALEEEEVAEGYILTCQSHPTSEKLVVSFDD